MIWKGFYVFTSFVSLQMIVSLVNIFILMMMTILIEMYLVFDRQCFSFFMNKLVILVCLNLGRFISCLFLYTHPFKKTI